MPREQVRPPQRRFTAQMGALEPCLCVLGPPSALHSVVGGWVLLYSATGIAQWGPPQGFVGVYI